MKKSVIFTGVMLAVMGVVVFFTSVAVADEKATKEECVTKVAEAAKMVREVGVDAAIQKLSDESGPYRWKDSYVFCIEDGDGKMLAHPIPAFIGYAMKNFRDLDGKQPFVEVLDVVKTKKDGWVKYKVRPRGENDPKMKNTYFLKVPGEKIILSAGYLE